MAEVDKSEKITVNTGLVDLGQIHLLVNASFYANRTTYPHRNPAPDLVAVNRPQQDDRPPSTRPRYAALQPPRAGGIA